VPGYDNYYEIKAGSSVRIIAAPAPAGKVFSRWNAVMGSAALPGGADGLFTMPAGDLELAAVYVNAGGGGGSAAGGGGGAADGGQALVTGDGGVVVLDYTREGGDVVINLPESKVSEMIENAPGGTASFDLTKLPLAEAVTFMPKTALSAIAGEGLRVVVLFPGGEAVLDAEAVSSLVSQARGPEITVEVRKLKTAEVEALETVPPGAAVYEVSAYSGGVSIHSYSGKLSVRAPYAGGLPAAVWYMDEPGRLEKLPCEYGAASGTLSFSPPHLSLYVLGRDALPWPFIDVAEGADWFFSGVEYVYSSGLMKGTGEDIFEPHYPLTRGMLATVIGRYLEADTAGYAESAFSDVDALEYYSPYIAWAAAKGLVKGVGEGRFAPDAQITRQDFVTMLYRCAVFMDKGPQGAWTSRLPFVDAADIADYAGEAVMWAYTEGVVNGREGNVFDPAANATRAEAAVMFMRFAEAVR
jgi:hypothetical protein